MVQMRIPCEKCPVRIALQEEAQQPGTLYEYKRELAAFGLGELPSRKEFQDAVVAVGLGLEDATPECPGLSKGRYLLGKIGTRALKYTDFFGKTPNSVAISRVCSNPFLDTPDYEQVEDQMGEIFIEY